MKGAKGVLINITGGLDMTLHEVDEAANRIREEVDGDANIIFGSTFDATMDGRMRVSVVATGIAAMAAQQPAPNYLSLDMNRPVQTGQPALSRPVAPPVGRVAMPAAAAAAPLCRRCPRPRRAARRVAAGSAVRRPRRLAASAPAPIMASMPTAGCRSYEAPIRRARAWLAPVTVEAPVAPAPAPMPGSPSRRRRLPPRRRAGGPAASAGRRERLAHQPSVDGQGAAVRAEPVARPMAARPADRQPCAEPVPAHHRRLLGAEARDDGGRSGRAARRASGPRTGA